MPELPEVETVRIGLKIRIVGKKIQDVSYDWQKSFPNSDEYVNLYVKDSTVTSVRRRGKVLIIDLSTGYSLMVHLKMTGQLVFVPMVQKSRKSKAENVEEERFGAGHPNDSLAGRLPDKSTRVIITFEDESRLFFNDQRKFGWMRLLATPEIVNEPFLKRLGPEPLEENFTPDIFTRNIRRRLNTSIKAALLDQTVLAGVGNIYADESLWGAQIHPATKVKKLSTKQLHKLHEEILYALRLSLEKGGSTDRNYVNAEGKKGSYIQFARVFRKEGSPCPRCGEVITKTRVAGRGTHLCPACQSIS